MSVIGNTCAVTQLSAVEVVGCKDGQNLTVSPVSAAERQWEMDVGSTGLHRHHGCGLGRGCCLQERGPAVRAAEDDVWRGTTTSGVTGHSLQGGRRVLN